MDHARIAMINKTNRIPEGLFKHEDGRKTSPPGIYMSLYHGRTDPAQEMDDWGFDCAYTIGPINHIVQTYNSTTRLLMGTHNEIDVWITDAVNQDELHFIKPNVLVLFDDMLYLNGSFYGDWSFFSA